MTIQRLIISFFETTINDTEGKVCKSTANVSLVDMYAFKITRVCGIISDKRTIFTSPIDVGLSNNM